MTPATKVGVVVDHGPVEFRLSMPPAWRGPAVTIFERHPQACRWFTEHNATSQLQRPDFHLYDTATSLGSRRHPHRYLRTRLTNQPARQGALP